jgi:hypothetical protein
MPASNLAIGSAIAGGAIAAALVETLFDKGILTLEDTRAVLNRAMNLTGPHAQTDGGFEAGQIIASLLRDRFPASRRVP